MGIKKSGLEANTISGILTRHRVNLRQLTRSDEVTRKFGNLTCNHRYTTILISCFVNEPYLTV